MQGIKIWKKWGEYFSHTPGLWRLARGAAAFYILVIIRIIVSYILEKLHTGSIHRTRTTGFVTNVFYLYLGSRIRDKIQIQNIIHAYGYVIVYSTIRISYGFRVSAFSALA